MPFAKLDDGIVDSSLWAAPDHVVRVWITILAKKDRNGMIRVAFSALRRISNIYNDPDGIKFQEAINVLESPDSESRTTEYEGRRIEKVEGGWMVLNHEKYRLHDNIVKEQNRERAKRFRENHKLIDKKKQPCNASVTLRNVTDALPSVSVSVSEEEEREKEIKEFKTFYFIYPGQKRADETEFSEFKIEYPSKYKDYLFILVESIKKQIESRKKLLSEKKFFPTWKSMKNYLKMKGWEESFGGVQKQEDKKTAENETLKMMREAKKTDKITAEEYRNLMTHTVEWGHMTKEQQEESIKEWSNA
jgi:hypothetical protein